VLGHGRVAGLDQQLEGLRAEPRLGGVPAVLLTVIRIVCDATFAPAAS
jgi:hypothetical protein